MPDPFTLSRFVEAQDPVYDRVCAELKAGRKSSHWMWFIFPQIAGLGMSATSQRFAIAGMEEAKAYLDHPLLGPRLRECTDLVLAVEGRTADEIFGSIDALKFRSSMTLFARADGEESNVFRQALDVYYDGVEDDRTLSLLGDAA